MLSRSARPDRSRSSSAERRPIPPPTARSSGPLTLIGSDELARRPLASHGLPDVPFHLRQRTLMRRFDPQDLKDVEVGVLHRTDQHMWLGGEDHVLERLLLVAAGE